MEPVAALVNGFILLLLLIAAKCPMLNMAMNVDPPKKVSSKIQVYNNILNTH